MNDGTGMQRSFRAKDAEAGKFHIFPQVVGTRARAHKAASAQVNDAADNGIVAASLFGIAQYGVSAVDAFHLYGPARAGQIGVVAARKLAIGSLQCIAVGVQRNIEESLSPACAPLPPRS